MRTHKPACKPRSPRAPSSFGGLRPLLAAGLSIGLAGPALAVDHTWFGGSGDWSVGANWAPASVPGSGDKAIVNAGTATLSSSATVGALDLGGGATVNVSSGTLMPTGGTSSGTFNIAAGAKLEFRNGNSALNAVTTSGLGIFEISTENVGADAYVAVNGGTHTTPFVLSGSNLTGTDHTFLGAVTWTGGSIVGDGSTAGFDSTTFENDVAISGANPKTLWLGRTVNLQATTTWSGNTGNLNNAIRFWNGGTINNNGTFNDANGFDSFIQNFAGSPSNFNNIGTYNKQSNTITSVGVAFNSTGTVNVNAGTFMPTGGTSSGTFNIAAGAKLEFRNGNSALNAVTTSGQGIFEISTDGVGADAYVAVNGGTHTTPFVLSGSNLTGTDHTFLGAVTWTGGSIVGDGSTAGFDSTTFENDVAISGANPKTLWLGRTVNLQATTTWSGNTGNLNNAIRFWNGGTINNNGTFNDANGFDSFIQNFAGSPSNFNNIGTYNKQSNTITSVGVAFNNTGTVNVNAGTFLPTGGISSGTFNIAAGAKLEFRNGSSTLDNATTSGDGILQVSTDGVGGDAVLTVNGGTHTSRVLLSGSILTGTDHTFKGPATWTGGQIYGAASTTFDNDLTISGPSTKTIILGRIINLNGTTTWSGNTANNNNAIDFVNGGTINNYGTFNDENTFNSFIAHNRGGPHSFNNVGTFNKQSNTTTLIENFVVFNNTGTVNVNAGTLQVTSALTNQGLVNIAAGATFLGSSNTFVNAGTIAGNGTVATLAGGDIVNQGDIDPGFGIGHLTVAEDLNQQAAGALNFELASLASFDTLGVTDDVRLAGSIVAVNAGYVPAVGDMFVVLTFDQYLSGTRFDSVTTQGYGSGVTFGAIYNPHDVTLVVVTVPEPETYAMLLAGLALVSTVVRRRRRSAAGIRPA